MTASKESNEVIEMDTFEEDNSNGHPRGGQLGKKVSYGEFFKDLSLEWPEFFKNFI